MAPPPGFIFLWGRPAAHSGRCIGALLQFAAFQPLGNVMVKPLVRAALAASLLVFFAGCEQKSAETAATAPAAAATPDAAILASVQSIKQGDIAGLMQNALPPADFAKAKADWGKDQEPITEENRTQFNETMAKLTAP